MARGLEIITLDPAGAVHPIALVGETGAPMEVIIRGDPPARFVHAGRAWCATGEMIQPPACPLSYEYRPAAELS
ncbi:hypothetical protein DEJ23_12245 [Curtobacterium sp. MCSS17_008]|uniref:hypothetical protein n=1 Tax=Curtobacterium sp. MCSS17_008 TaxID=2175647 RepID=UPI000DAA91E1|nr:hypothetical protein [Curtobacterium sp. MCSS17_008]PZF55259.1 hypothetical protein DEJ23_12245 [Curtobacterium sp. MCSS17_008]